MAAKSTKSIIQFVILLGIGVLLIWLTLRQVAPKKDEIILAFKNANYFWILLSMLIAFLSHFLRAYRWNYLLEPLGYKTKLINANCYVLIGYLANYGIPRMGEISRCTLATKYDKVPFEVALGTVITERIIDFILFLGIFVLTLLIEFKELSGLANHLIFQPLKEKLSGIENNPTKLIVLIVIVFLGVGLFIFLRKKVIGLMKGKLGGIIKGLAQGIGSIRKMKRPLGFIILSVLIWLCYFYSLYMCFFALTGTENLGQGACLTLLLFGTFGVILSPGGLGAYPAIVGGILLTTYHVDQVWAFALPWLAWTSQLVLVLVFGLISFIVLPIYNRNKNGVLPSS
ncbi:MAG: lysylphosphatidylglycerol synthase transmembrane domain-containing protein [Bacteroidota bacterium]|nr:lysylphosphatidylglycerol synthase transmembrane domain-containing protein [Bacteroidota bacterium]